MGQKVPASRVEVKGGVIAGASVKQGGRGNLGDGKTCDSPRAHDGANGLCDQRGKNGRANHFENVSFQQVKPGSVGLIGNGAEASGVILDER